MNEVLSDARAWLKAGQSVAIATVVRTWGSAPRRAGSKMAVSASGEMSGSVSGGCVEAAVVEESLAALKDGRPRRLHYGVSDDAAWEVGLTCGGEIDILVEPLGIAGPGAVPRHLLVDALAEADGASAAFVRAVIVEGSADDLGRSIRFDSDARRSGDISEGVADLVAADAQTVLLRGEAETRRYPTPAGEVEVLLDPWLPAPTLAIVGAVHIAMILARLAHAIGYRVAIVDPRGAFATPNRFPDSEVIDRSWPDQALTQIGLTPATAVVVLSHDPKLDDPALLVALPSPAFYVGALGSRRTNERRRARLRAAGLPEEGLQRLHAPIGIDLGRQDPEGIALGILAEIVATRAGLSVEVLPATAAGASARKT